MEWKGTSCSLKASEQEKDEVVKKLNLTEKNYSFKDGLLQIFNHENILFFESNFLVIEKLEFDFFLTKFKKKSLSDISLFNETTFELIQINKSIGNSKREFETLLEDNNIITDGISEDKLIIPPTLFSELQLSYSEKNFKEKRIYSYLAELFSLFAIADKTKISVEEDNTYFYFTIFRTNKNNHVIKVPWRKWDYFNGNIFFNCFEWITIKSKESFKLPTIIQVVREYLGTLDNISLSKDIISSLDSILNRIIKNETKDYFDQQNKLKDEFITYKKMEIESRNSLMKSLLGLISAIGLAYYGKVIGIENFKFMMEDTGIALIFWFSLVAVTFFIFTFIVSYRERVSYYDSLRDIYIDAFLFSKDDVERVLKKPSLFKEQLLYWVTLIMFILGIIFMIYAYSGGWDNIVSLLELEAEDYNNILIKYLPIFRELFNFFR